MILILSILIPIILIFLVKKISKCTIKTQVVPPGPPGLPFIGNLHQISIASNQLHVYLRQLSRKYGPIMQLKIGSVPIIVISSAKFAKAALKTQDLAFAGRPRLVGLQKLSYNCLDIVVAPYGEHWRELRRVVAIHLLSTKKIQSFGTIREDEICRMIAKISGFASSNEVVNLNEQAMVFGSTLICRIAFGQRYDENGSQMRRFHELLVDAQALLATFFVSDYFPALSWVDKLTGLMSRLDRTFKNLDSFYEELIEDHINGKGTKTKEEEDILDVLIQIKEQNLCFFDLEWDRVKALLADIFIAATDTSAASIVWTMTALMKAPNELHKVQSEIRSMVGKKGVVNEDDLPKLPYLKATINEALRLYPPAPLLVPRETTQKCSLDGYQIEPKTIVYVNAWAIARDPEHWENPNEFLPERFLNSDIDVKGQDFEVIPFGSGRRICPGMLMGLANVELTVANLLYSFDWESHAQDIDTDCLPGIAMHKKNPLLLLAKKYVV